jgi:uncharacterized protein YktA (UPF0223 family)
VKDNNFKDFISIDGNSKSIIITHPILLTYTADEISELLNFYEETYRDYKIFYCEGGEPITPESILNLYRIHEFFLEKKINTKKLHIFYENRSTEYENLLGFLQFNFYYYPYHINSNTPLEFFDSGDFPYRLETDFEGDMFQIVNEKKYDTAILSIDSTFISEETFKALAFPRPFIVIGQKNVLKNLKIMGFKTFSNIIDESYDEMDDSIRMKAVEKLILDLKNKPKEELYSMWLECIDIYEHNRKSIIFHCKEFEAQFSSKFEKEYSMLNEHYLLSIKRSKQLKLW